MPKESPPSVIATEVEAAATAFDEELAPHFKTTLYFTFAFCVAWSWDLVAYGASHVVHGISPLQNQLSFGDSPGPKNLLVLILQYLVVCGAAAFVSDWLNGIGRKWTKGAYSSSLLLRGLHRCYVALAFCVVQRSVVSDHLVSIVMS